MGRDNKQISGLTIALILIFVVIYCVTFVYLIASPNLFDIKVTVLDEAGSPFATSIALYKGETIERIGTTDEMGRVYFLGVKEDEYTIRAEFNIYGIITTERINIDVKETNIDALIADVTFDRVTKEAEWVWSVE